MRLRLAVLVAFVCAPRLAEAAEPDRLAAVEAAIAEGHLEDARAALDVLASSEDADEHLAAIDVRAVVETWIAAGGRHTRRGVVTLPEAATTWRTSFDAARLCLLGGENGRAARSFALLAQTAHHPSDAARARALGGIARTLEAVQGDVADDAVPEGIAAPPAPPPPRVERRWYGWQTLVVDGGSVMMVPFGEGKGAVVAAIGYGLGGPIVHAAHGRWGAAATSLGVRVGFALGGCGFGAAMAGNGGDTAVGCGFMGGLGALSAIIVDAAMLAREDPKPVAERPSVGFAPSVAPRKEGGIDIGLGGTF